MKKIKVYNLKKSIEENDFNGKQLTTFSFYDKLAIIEGSKGVLIFDDEGVGYLKESVTDEFEIGLNDIPEQKSNTIFATPQYNLNISSKEIIEKAEHEEIELTQFIKRYNYNSRMRDNFSTLLKSINEIGLKSKDYYKSVK